MIYNHLLASAVACMLSVQLFAQEPAKSPSTNAAAADSKIPPAPEKSLKRDIWLGYYTALLNRNYHLERSVQMDLASASDAKYGRIIAVVSFIAPFIIMTLLLQHAVKQKTESKKLAATLGPTLCTIAVLAVVGFGMWYGLESTLDGSAEQARAMAHKELYRDWKTLADQWQEVHALSLEHQPNEILHPLYVRLHALEEAISARETTDLYDPELHRQVQAKLNDYLIKDAKQVKG